MADRRAGLLRRAELLAAAAASAALDAREAGVCDRCLEAARVRAIDSAMTRWETRRAVAEAERLAGGDAP